MKLQLKPIKLNIASVEVLLVAVLVVVVLFEIYLGYTNFYKRLFVEPNILPTENIVRVDLNKYNETINLIESYENYSPENYNLNTTNPFQ